MTQSGKRRNILKRRKNRFRSVVMLGLVAFIMLSPQAREVVWEKQNEHQTKTPSKAVLGTIMKSHVGW